MTHYYHAEKILSIQLARAAPATYGARIKKVVKVLKANEHTPTTSSRETLGITHFDQFTMPKNYDYSFLLVGRREKLIDFVENSSLILLGFEICN